MRRRIGALAAVSFVVCGFLLAIGLGVLVLAFVAGMLVSVAVVALLTVRDRARGLAAERVRRVGSAARGLAASSSPLLQNARGSTSSAAASLFVRRSSFARAAVVWSSRARNEAIRAAGAARSTLIALARRATRIDPQRQALRLNAEGAQLRRERRYDEAVDRHRRALELLRALGDRRGVALTQSNLALALSHSGDDDWAIGLFEEAAATLRELGDHEREAQIMANLGLAHRRYGRREEGDNVLELALAKLSPESNAYHAIEEQLRRAS